MKKLLALILSIALCFTVFAGCIATSAAAPDFSVSANGNVVTVSGTIAENSQYAVMLKITLDDDLTLASIADGNGTPLEAYAEDKETWHYVLDNTGKIISALELYNDTFTYVITVNAPANDSCEAPSDPYAVSVVADYADYNADAPTLEQYTGSADVIVPAKAHTPAEAVKENEVAAEVGKEGSYDNVVYCSACNTELSRENVKVPALEPEKPECEHANAVREITKATTTELKFTYTCPDCDAEPWDETHAVAVTTAYKFGHTLEIESDITLNFRIAKSSLSAYSDIFAVFDKVDYSDATPKYVPNIMFASDLVANDPTNTRYVFSYTGIAAKQMNDTINAKLYMKAANGAYSCIVEDYTIVDYVNTIMKQPTNDTYPAELKTALMDMVNYGSKAQIYFNNYNVENLAADAIDSQYYSWATDPIISTYTDTSVTVPLEGGDSVVTGWYRTLECINKVVFNIRMKAETINDNNIDNYKLVIEYTNISGAVVPFEVLGSSGEIEFKSDRWVYAFDKIAAMQFATDFSVTLCDLEGNAVSSTWTTNIKNYVAVVLKQTNETTYPQTLKTMLTYMLTYGDSCNAYFISRQK